MHAAEWIALITPTLAIVGTGVAGVVKITRMTVALETISGSIKTAADKIENHEGRISALEARSPGRHARAV